MLDRKTKDIDASIELLEDRIKGIDIGFYMMAIALATFGITGEILVLATEYVSTGLLTFMIGIMALIGAVMCIIGKSHINILIYLKQHETKRK